MRNDPNIYVIIAIALFMVGVDLPNVQDVVLVQEPESADEWVQWGGRAGRDISCVSDARVITYVTKKGLKTAHGIVEAASSDPTQPIPTRKKSSAPAMDVSSAQLIIAQCKVAAQNELYANPSRDEPCTCVTCTLRPRPSLPSLCSCSGCLPEDSTMSAQPSRSSGKTNPVPKSKRLTRVMRKHGMQRLEKVRDEIYDSLSNSAASRALPPTVYLPQPVITSILDNYALLSNVDDLKQHLTGRTFTVTLPHADILWSALEALRPEFEEIRVKAAEERKRKAAEKAARQQAEAAGARAHVLSPEELEAAIEAALNEDSEDSEDELACFRQPQIQGAVRPSSSASQPTIEYSPGLSGVQPAAASMLSAPLPPPSAPSSNPASLPLLPVLPLSLSSAANGGGVVMQSR